MAYTDRYTGKDLVVEFTPEGGGGPYVLTADFQAFAMDRKTDTVDVSAGSETDRRYLPTLTGLDWTLSVYGGNENVLKFVKSAAKGTLFIYPKGKVAGRPMRQFDAIVTSYKENYPFDGAHEVEIGGVRNGPMVKDVGDTM